MNTEKRIEMLEREVAALRRSKEARGFDAKKAVEKVVAGGKVAVKEAERTAVYVSRSADNAGHYLSKPFGAIFLFLGIGTLFGAPFPISLMGLLVMWVGIDMMKGRKPWPGLKR